MTVDARKETATSAPIAAPADVGTNPIPLADVTPDELYLPWRTLCHALSGARYLGSIDLPGGSQESGLRAVGRWWC